MNKKLFKSLFSSIKKKAIVLFSKNVNIDQRTFEYPEEIIRGLEEWGLLDDSFGDKYFTNDLISSFIESIRQSILNDETSFIQILGLAGLGKTRLVYECFHQFTAYSSEVFYCNAASQEGEIQRYLLKLVKEKKEGVLIVDNCNSSLNEILYSELPKNEGSLNIITIDKEVNERHGSHKKIEQFILKPQHFEKDVIPEMVKFYYPQLPSADVEKIAAFSQGFPMIAKLLANGLDLGVENIGELTDDALLRKLIGANETEDEDAFMINEFGDDDKLLNEIHANFGSYGSVGSSVPYLKSKLHLLQQITDHPIKRVRIWANNYISEMKRQIEHEELRDEEWGIT